MMQAHPALFESEAIGRLVVQDSARQLIRLARPGEVPWAQISSHGTTADGEEYLTFVHPGGGEYRVKNTNKTRRPKPTVLREVMK